MVSGWWEEESARTARVHSGPEEVKRLDRMGSPPNPSPSAWTPRAVLCTGHQLKKVKETEDQAPSVFYPQEAEIMK